MSALVSWAFLTLVVAVVVLCCVAAWPTSSRPDASTRDTRPPRPARRGGDTDSTGRRAGADTGSPAPPQTGPSRPHGAAPTLLTPCPDCGHVEALAFTDALVCKRCASVWQAPASEAVQ